MPSALDFNSISSNLRQSKNSSDNSKQSENSGALNKIPGAGNIADIGSELRQGKLGAAAEKGVGMAMQTALPGVGKVALKAGKTIGIPVEKIILFSIKGLLLILFLIILGGGYAVTHKWDVLKFMFEQAVDKVKNSVD